MRRKKVLLFVVAGEVLGMGVIPPRPKSDRFAPIALPMDVPEGWDDFVCPGDVCAVDDDGCAVDEVAESAFDDFGSVVKGIFPEQVVDDRGPPEPSSADLRLNALLRSPVEAEFWRKKELFGIAPSSELLDLDSKGRPKYVEDFVFVDEAKCLGCGTCARLAAATFFNEPNRGKGRAFLQGGDAAETLDEAIQACPRSAIQRVDFHQLREVEQKRAKLNGEPINIATAHSEKTTDDDDFQQRLSKERHKFFHPKTSSVDL